MSSPCGGSEPGAQPSATVSPLADSRYPIPRGHRPACAQQLGSRGTCPVEVARGLLRRGPALTRAPPPPTRDPLTTLTACSDGSPYTAPPPMPPGSRACSPPASRFEGGLPSSCSLGRFAPRRFATATSRAPELGRELSQAPSSMIGTTRAQPDATSKRNRALAWRRGCSVPGACCPRRIFRTRALLFRRGVPGGESW